MALTIEEANECFAAMCSHPDFQVSHLNYPLKLLNQSSAQKSDIVEPFLGTIIKNIRESNLLVIFIKEFKINLFLNSSYTINNIILIFNKTKHL